MRLRVGHKHTQIWPILARFMDYYSLFWGPIVIFTINEPWDAFTCRSSTLVVLADFGPFLGLLLTDLGSVSEFHDFRTPGCLYISFSNNPRFVRFWALSWTITHRFGVTKRFPWLSNPNVCLRVGHQHSKFWPVLTRFVHYYSPFWGSEAITIVVEPQGALTCRSHSQIWLILARFMDYYSLFGVPG